MAKIAIVSARPAGRETGSSCPRSTRPYLAHGEAGCFRRPKLLPWPASWTKTKIRIDHSERTRLSPRAEQYSPGGPATLPAVSVVMPVLNEERHLAESVTAVLGQEYPGGFELVLAIGPSKDRTEAIARELAAADSRVTVVPNPSGQIASAMNAAVRTARHAHHHPHRRALHAARRLPADRGAHADGDRRRRRRRLDGRRGRHPVPAGRRLGDDLAVRHGRGRQPHRRRPRARRHGLPGRLPPVRDRAGRRLRRDHADRRGLGAELPDPRGRRPDLVHPGPEGDLPAAGHAAQPWPGSSSATAAGGGSSRAATRRRSAPATWPRRW